MVRYSIKISTNWKLSMSSLTERARQTADLLISLSLIIQAPHPVRNTQFKSANKNRTAISFEITVLNCTDAFKQHCITCSVKTYGKYLRPPYSSLEVAICDLKLSYSSFVNWKQKFSGNLAMLSFTRSFNRFQLTIIGNYKINFHVISMLFNRIMSIKI